MIPTSPKCALSHPVTGCAITLPVPSVSNSGFDIAFSSLVSY